MGDSGYRARVHRQRGKGMRIASILAATASIAWLAFTLWDLPIPRALHVYNFCLFTVGVIGYFVAGKIKQSDPEYVPFYTAMLALVVIPMGWTAIELGKTLGLRGVYGAFVIMLCVAWFTKLFNAHVPNSFDNKLTLTQGYLFCVAGLFVLASAVPLQSVLNFRLRIFLGAYWLVTGAYAFCHSLGMVRAATAWQPLAGWFQGSVTVLFLGGLALALSGLQPELGPQHSRDEAIQELVWENAE